MDGSNRKEQKMEDNEREGGMYLRAGRAIERRGSAKGACKIHVIKRKWDNR